MPDIGVDIEEIDRFRRCYRNERFINLIYTQAERRYCMRKVKPYISYAGKFCAKEAVLKAYGKKVPLNRIEIMNLKSGKLAVRIDGKKQDGIRCTISHTDRYAVAVAISSGGS